MAARDEEPELNEPPSKSQRKRDAEDLKDLGDELVALPAGDLEALPLPEKLRDAIDLARRGTVRGDPTRQVDCVPQLLRQRQRLEVARRQRHELVAQVLEILGVPLALALADLLVGIRRPCCLVRRSSHACLHHLPPVCTLPPRDW